MQTTTAATPVAILVVKPAATHVAKKNAAAPSATQAAANRAVAQPSAAIHVKIAPAKHQAKPTSSYGHSIKVFAQN